jgi:predicted ester cyclase
MSMGKRAMTNSESLVKDYLASGDGGDLELLGRYLHDDVILHDPTGQSMRGLDREKETWRTSRAAMPDLRHEVKEVVGSGSVVAARIKVSGTLRGAFAGVSAEAGEFEVDQAIFMHLSGGKVQEMWTIVDTGGFYQQVGAYPGQ